MDGLDVPFFDMTNYQDHPTRPGYMVFRFKSEEIAEVFEGYLKEGDYFYEKFVKTKENGDVTVFFGTKISKREEIVKLNYTAIGKFREPIIKDKGVKMVVVAIGVLILLFAIVSAIVSNISD